MKFFDLFSGVGGFRLGMERNGNICIGSCEIDEYARKTYTKNFRREPEYRDAREINPGQLPDFDCLCAGFPCQAFSVAGKRRGFEDTRGSIFFEIARIAKEKQPRYLFLENVKGLLSHDNGETFRVIISTLDEVGYDAEWQVLNSKYFVPQNRERIFIIGHLRGERTRKIFPLGDYDEKTTRQIKHIVNSDGQDKRVYNVTGIGHDQHVARTMIKEGVKTEIYKIVADRSRNLAGLGRNLESPKSISNSLTSAPKDNLVLKDCREKDTETMIYLSNKNANMKERIQEREESWTLGTGTDFAIIQNNSGKGDNREKYVKTSAIIPTLQSGGGGSQKSFVGNNNDGVKIRRLTPIECERLQGFPDNWTSGLSDTQRYKQMGNAVTVNVVQYIAANFDDV